MVVLPPASGLTLLQLPVALQDVGELLADQIKVEELPTVVLVGLAVRVTTGAGGLTFTLVARLLVVPV